MNLVAKGLAAHLIVTAGLGHGLAAASQAVEINPVVGQFVANYCLDCHDDTDRKGGLSIESLGQTVTAANAADWLRLLEQIERGTMPPPDMPQPTRKDRDRVGHAVERAVVAQAEQQAVDRSTVLRRLNRAEYRHTLEDLLALDLSSRDPTNGFPADTRIHGFASSGEALVTSSFLLRHYLDAADDIVARAVHFEPRPEPQRWTPKPPFDRTSLGIAYGERKYYSQRLRQPQPHQSLFYRGRRLPIEDLRDGVPMSGWYQIRVLAEARFRDADIDHKKMFGGTSLFDPSQPLRLVLEAGTLAGIDPANKDAITEALVRHRASDQLLATWDVPDDDPTWLEARVWLEQGQFPKFSFPNGPTGSNYRLVKYVKENIYTLLNKEQLAAYEEANYSGDWFHLLFFETPRIRLHRVECRGPLNDQWPPPSHRMIFGEEPYDSAAAGEVLRAFAERAWRRPVHADEIASIEHLVRQAEQRLQADGVKAEPAAQAAIERGIKAILCAPEFLYREERQAQLNSYEIASRLSYFLWSSLPDDRLLNRAARDDLQTAGGRREEAERLLADPRSDRFVAAFLDGWIELQKLGTMAPVFPVYFDDQLEPAMRTETRLFFKRLLQTNGPIADLLDSDYTFVNQQLAKHYGLDWRAAQARLGEPVAGLTAADLQPDRAGDAPSTGFVRVSLPDRRRRGGLLGQGAVLTLTANGVDTSPVIRGAWVLENILGARPSPPPPDVPTIEPDVRGTTTVRDRLQKHRENPACLSCHQHIDPPGFALESFNAIGTWRGHYVNGKHALPIDSSGRFAGRKFEDFGEFKEILLDLQPQVARCLVEHLFVHALGRELTVADRPAIRVVLEQAAAEGYRLRDLVLLCCESELWTRK